MPSKYSHSVVLAHYSSLGLINLPNDQLVEYLKIARPVSDQSLRSGFATSTVRSNRSAGSSRTKQSAPPPRDQALLSKENLNTPKQNSQDKRRRVIIDSDFDSESEDVNTHNSSEALTDRSQQPISHQSSGLPPAEEPIFNTLTSVLGERPAEREDCKRPLHTRTTQGSSKVSFASDRANTHGKSQRVSDHEEAKAYRLQRQFTRDKPLPDRRKLRDLLQQDTEQPTMLKFGSSSTNTRPNTAVRLPSRQPVSPVDSTLASTPPKSEERPPAPIENSSSYSITTQIVNPLPEDANFDGFSDTNFESDLRIEHPVQKPVASVSRSSPDKWEAEQGQSKERVGMPDKPEQAPRALDPLKALSNNGTFLAAPSPSIKPHQSFDSLSSLNALDVPIVERGHPLRSGWLADRGSAQSRVEPGRPSAIIVERNTPLSASPFEAISPDSEGVGPLSLSSRNRKLSLQELLNLDSELELDRDRTASPSDIANYRVQNNIGSSLAQVGMQLDESNMEKGRGTGKSATKSRDEQIRDAEQKLKELKEGNDSGHEPSPQPKARGGKLFKRFRS